MPQTPHKDLVLLGKAPLVCEPLGQLRVRAEGIVVVEEQIVQH